MNFHRKPNDLKKTASEHTYYPTKKMNYIALKGSVLLFLSLALYPPLSRASFGLNAFASR